MDRIPGLLTEKEALLRGGRRLVDEDIVTLKIKTQNEFYFFKFVECGNQASFETYHLLITAATQGTDCLNLDRIRFGMGRQITVQPER